MISKPLAQDEFFENYNINLDDFKSTGLMFSDLITIQTDYDSKFQMYDDAGAGLVRILLRFESVHSVKYRIKNSEHLIEKIIRKSIADKSFKINISNYQEKIQDLIGIRIMHLFKSDWLSIHNKLTNTFKIMQKPEANLRKGDFDVHFKDNGCKIKIHKAGYRSVHYLVKTEPTIKAMLAEIQVRTILEEAWSEIDHKIRYPYNLDNDLINQYLQIFNRMAGSADEMGDYVLQLNADVLSKNEEIINLQLQIKATQEKVENSSLVPTEKKEFSDDLNSIKNMGAMIANPYANKDLFNKEGYSTYPSNYYLERLKAQVLSQSNIGNVRPDDCNTIASKIFNDTRMSISGTTLKRVFGFAYSKFKPSLFTMDAMAQYCGYDNWDGFVKAQDRQS